MGDAGGVGEGEGEDVGEDEDETVEAGRGEGERLCSLLHERERLANFSSNWVMSDSVTGPFHQIR